MGVFTKDIEVGVVASPTGMAVGQSSVAQVSNHVTIGIENTDFGNGGFRKVLLAACFAQQILGFEGGHGIVVLVRQDRWHFSHRLVFWILSLTYSIIVQPVLYGNLRLNRLRNIEPAAHFLVHHQPGQRA